MVPAQIFISGNVAYIWSILMYILKLISYIISFSDVCYLETCLVKVLVFKVPNSCILAVSEKTQLLYYITSSQTF